MTIEDIVGITVVSLLVGSLLADLLLDITWNKTYFRYGLTIFIKRIPVNNCHTNIPSQTLFENKFHSDMISSLVFKEMDTYSYGFRDEVFQFKWIRTPNLMHGLLMFDTNNNQVVVKGFSNLFTLAFSLLWLGLPLSGIVSTLFTQQPLVSVLIPLGAIGGFGVMMGICYLFQASRFSNVAAFAAQSWERKYVRQRDEA